MQIQLKKLQEILLIAASFSLALPPLYVDVCMGLFAITWLVSGNFQSKLNRIKNNHGALIATTFFALYIIGMFYSSASFKESLSWLGREHHLLFIPLIVAISPSIKCRLYAINAFIASMLITLAASWGKWVGLIPLTAPLGSGQEYTLFKFSIALSLFMSYAMFLMILKAQSTHNKVRAIWTVLALLAGLNVLFLSNARTGQVTMIALLLLLIYKNFGKKSIQSFIGVLAFLGLLLLVTPNSFHSRLTNIPYELTHHTANQPTSSGERMEMLKNTLTLIEQHPFFGGGTGSLRPEYDALVKNKDVAIKKMNNPHNQYILVSQHLGVMGLLILILMFWSQWKVSGQLSNRFEADALKGLILAIAIGSFFNCLLLAGEGKFYYVLAGVLLSGWQPGKADA